MLHLLRAFRQIAPSMRQMSTKAMTAEPKVKVFSSGGYTVKFIGDFEKYEMKPGESCWTGPKITPQYLAETELNRSLNNGTYVFKDPIPMSKEDWRKFSEDMAELERNDKRLGLG